MTRYRVYTLADGTEAKVYPAPKSRAVDESESDWYARVMAKTEAGNPALAGRPYEDRELA